MLTYPRTDSKALPEDYVDTAKQVLRNLQGSHLGAVAGKVLKEGWVKPNKRIFNNTKISDHHAIIPTVESPEKLDELERKVYDLVAKRFIAIFYPTAHFEVTTRITRVEGEPFKTEGKILVYARLAGSLRSRGTGAPTIRPRLWPCEKVRSSRPIRIEVQGLQTRPPARFTEATLLSAMEGAGKLVEDEDLREAMGAKGLGTPATRAAIIEKLLAEEYHAPRGPRNQLRPRRRSALLELLGGGRYPRAGLARDDRRVGIQAQADGARRTCRAAASWPRSLI